MKLVKLFTYLTASITLFSTNLAAQERIVSIGGDVTEIIYALNAEQQLIGRDSTSIIPERAKSLPDVGYMRQLNTEGILALKPNKIIATEIAQPSVVLEQLKAAGVTVEQVPFKNTAEGVIEKITRIGELLNRKSEAVALSEKFTNEMKTVENSPRDVKVLFVMTRSGNSQMVAGTDTVPDSAIKLVGAKNAMSNAARFVPISQEGVIAANPDLIVLTSLGVKNLGSLDKLWQLPGVAHTTAGKKKQVVIVDDIAFLAFGLTIPQELHKMRQAVEKASQ
ncbi:hemin ABC transporter substrate-binding protein [Ursidibacter maritimus]|uniref:Hemin ABC transporter substrate-binding protein n=1 Tax=Ursidibacter maritimus TaxID=1331689 RepID=A0A949SX03_9PAST|nr:hemin ABC transporter substrate-binding protein [Ursidibacter maritimus]KAE9540379.1 hemin ABC transporter substrate-binding protein [Ursidibacter maritimus]MBV6523497.1 hemin ABC transporter substrate-binding protein [Ursidibacter maritimus]MBV6525252.1 hemin ABC transporter substrate-binding protein [Ursidibacter maritimus]MBV6528079.1 hemin ABC transporter substrate-binding protein [Ursidibacter maritimus]MBV6530355.1 hemin ABC transporter substrate-binding protein [Ursidibacter maritimu